MAADTAAPAPASPPNHRRRRALAALAALVVVAGVAATLWWWFDGRWYEKTDDAYVQGNLVQLTPLIPGTVVRINADETALVRVGDPVVELDPADTETTLRRGEGGLGADGSPGARALREQRRAPRRRRAAAGGAPAGAGRSRAAHGTARRAGGGRGRPAARPGRRRDRGRGAEGGEPSSSRRPRC